MSKFSENATFFVALVIVILLLVALIGYFVMQGEYGFELTPGEIEIPLQPEPAPEEPSKAAGLPAAPAAPVEDIYGADDDQPAGQTTDEGDDDAAFVLPLLDDSDQLVRDGVISLTRHEEINAWLAPNRLILRFVAFADNLARGQIARGPIGMLAPTGPFLVRQIDETTWVLDSRSYDRYDKFVDVIESMNVRRAAEFYMTIRPLLRKAYAELGYPNQSFDDIVFRVISGLRDAPIIEGPIRLVKPVVMYQFQSLELELLSPAQKQIIRMGPANTRRFQAKLAELSGELRAALNR